LAQTTLSEAADVRTGGQGEGRTGDALAIFILTLIAFTMGLSPEFVAFQTRFAVFAQNMLREGPSFFPTLYGQPYPDYPGLPTFLIWLVSKPVGRVTPLTAILPTAIASSLILVIVYQIAALRSRAWGICAVLMTVLTYAFSFSARSITPDQYTALVTTASFYVCYSASELGRRRRLWWLPVFWVFGFACRGPIGLIVPAAVVGTYYLVRRKYRLMLVMGAGAGVLLAGCVGLLLAAAQQQGGKALVDQVIQFQAADRISHKYDSPLQYWLGCLGTYALGYPVAVVVVAVWWRRMVRRGDADAMLLACLAAWVVVVLAGMSIPGKKTMRYVLPIAPAAGLIAAYLMIGAPVNAVLRRVREVFVGLCGAVAPCAAIGAAVMWFVRGRFDPPIEGPFLWTAVLLGGVSVAGFVVRARRRDEERRARVSIVCAAVAFLLFMIGVAEPAEYSRDQSGPLVAAVQEMRRERPGPIGFYFIFPDNKDVKFMVNLGTGELPEWAYTTEALLAGRGVYFIAEEKDFRVLPSDVADKLEVRLRGRLGHDPVVVFMVRGA